MELWDRIVDTLTTQLECEFVLLADDDPLHMTGVAVSELFDGKSGLDRQEMIDNALAKSLRPEELRKVLFIAAMTPVEYLAVGARIRVFRVKAISNGAEVYLRGGVADAGYVREVLETRLGEVKTTEPEQSRGESGTVASFKVRGTKLKPLTKDKVMTTLKTDRYIEVLADA